MHIILLRRNIVSVGSRRILHTQVGTKYVCIMYNVIYYFRIKAHAGV